jgi:hypothetical protein
MRSRKDSTAAVSGSLSWADFSSGVGHSSEPSDGHVHSANHARTAGTARPAPFVLGSGLIICALGDPVIINLRFGSAQRFGVARCLSALRPRVQSGSPRPSCAVASSLFFRVATALSKPFATSGRTPLPELILIAFNGLTGPCAPIGVLSSPTPFGLSLAFRSLALLAEILLTLPGLLQHIQLTVSQPTVIRGGAIGERTAALRVADLLGFARCARWGSACEVVLALFVGPFVNLGPVPDARQRCQDGYGSKDQRSHRRIPHTFCSSQTPI